MKKRIGKYVRSLTAYLLLGITCGAVAVWAVAWQQRFHRGLQERTTQVGQEAVAWARDQAARLIGPGWEQQAVSFDDHGEARDDQVELQFTVCAICTWARNSPALAAVSEGEYDRFLKQETPYDTIWEIWYRLDALKAMAKQEVADFNFFERRMRFDELDAEIQELIRI